MFSTQKSYYDTILRTVIVRVNNNQCLTFPPYTPLVEPARPLWMKRFEDRSNAGALACSSKSHDSTHGIPVPWYPPTRPHTCRRHPVIARACTSTTITQSQGIHLKQQLRNHAHTFHPQPPTRSFIANNDHSTTPITTHHFHRSLAPSPMINLRNAGPH